MKTIAGIDPGKDGGIVVIDSRSNVPTYKMPVVGADVDFGQLCVLLQGVDLAIVEQVASMPKQGVVSVFSFGKSYGGVLGVLAAMAIPTELVRPQEWRRRLNIPKGSDKSAVLAWAKRRYPGVELIQPGCRVPHAGIVDALGIAHYGMQGIEHAA